MVNTVDLVRRITARDFTVQLDVPAGDASVVPAITPLLHHDDEVVRMLAVHCLGAVGVSDAARAITAAIDDEDPSVAGAALTALGGMDLASMPDVAAALLARLGAPLEPVVRRCIPVTLIQGGATPDVEALRAIADAEQDPEVQDDVLLLMAKLGDADARDRVARRVAAATGREVQRWTQRFDLVQGPWLVRGLVAWLDREEQAKRVGVDGVPDVPESIRACDVAVALLVALIGARVSFAMGPFVLYTPEQLDEVRDLVKAWLAAHPQHAWP